jgi:hypothetical protein
VTTGEYPLLYVFVIFAVRDDKMSGEVSGDRDLFLFWEGRVYVVVGGDTRGRCMCEKVKIHISAQQATQTRHGIY